MGVATNVADAPGARLAAVGLTVTPVSTGTALVVRLAVAFAHFTTPFSAIAARTCTEPALGPAVKVVVAEVAPLSEPRVLLRLH